MKRFLCDVDGIAADFMSEAVNVVNSITNQNLSYNDLHHWEVLDYVENIEHKKNVKFELNKPGVAKRLKLHESSIDSIKELNCITSLYFITSPSVENLGWFNERHAWLIEHFGVEPRQIGFLKDKFIVHGDFLLDDYEMNLIKWSQEPINNNGKALLWDRPWNKHVEHAGITRVYNWQEVLEIVKESI